jgi:hypothetical protein
MWSHARCEVLAGAGGEGGEAGRGDIDEGRNRRVDGGLRWGVEPICEVLTEHGLAIAPATDCEFALFEYLDWWNHRRLHGQIGMKPPAESEATYYRQSQPLETRPVPNEPSPYQIQHGSVADV